MPVLATQMAGQLLRAPGPAQEITAPMQDESYKQCAKCGESKPLGDFHRNGETKDGRRSDCKVCSLERVRAWNKANPERKAALSKRWAEANPERRAAAAKRSLARHPQKVRARWAVNNAARDGKLHKPDRCEDCGEITPSPDLRGHHDDYSKPLDVRWLCHPCHGREHEHLPRKVAE